MDFSKIAEDACCGLALLSNFETEATIIKYSDKSVLEILSKDYRDEYSFLSRPLVNFSKDGCQMWFEFNIGKAKLFKQAERDQLIHNFLSQAENSTGVRNLNYHIYEDEVSFHIDICPIDEIGECAVYACIEINKYLYFIDYVRNCFNDYSFRSISKKQDFV